MRSPGGAPPCTDGRLRTCVVAQETDQTQEPRGLTVLLLGGLSGGVTWSLTGAFVGGEDGGQAQEEHV